MRKILLPLALILATSAATAEEDGGLRDGFGLIQEGTRLLLRGLMDEIEPGLRELHDRIGDLSTYHPPEVLPNGDILLRRRVPLEPEDPPGEEIEL